MNREILFRGKRADNKEWIYGYLVKSEDYIFDYSERIDIPYIIPFDNFNLKDYREYRVIPETVSQYTELEDKNGNKIFEGDIVRNILILENNTFNENIDIVEFNKEDCSFMLGKGKRHFNKNLELEVIGNIFDEKENKE